MLKRLGIYWVAVRRWVKDLMSKNKPKSRVKNRNISFLTFPGDERVIDPSPLERFPEQAQTIAYVVAEWSQIDAKLTMWLALAMEEDGRIIRPMIQSIESSRARLDVTAAALRELVGDHPKMKGRLDDILKSAHSLLTLRNRYAHGHFGADRDSGELALGGPKPMNLPIHEIKHHLSLMKKLSHELALIVATQLGLPLKGPDAPDSVPSHPLGLRAARSYQEHQEPPQPSEA